MDVQRESLPGPSTLASASAVSTQDDCEYAESIDSDEHDLESEGSRSSEPVITAASILTQLRCPPASQLMGKCFQTTYIGPAIVSCRRKGILLIDKQLYETTRIIS